jgi:proline iminopeptidase
MARTSDSLGGPAVAALVLLAACAAPSARGKPSGGRVEEATYVRLGRLDQWVTLRGNARDAPILLVVHGGPGDVQSPFVSSYAPYEKDFIVVQWDQRGAGRTFAKYGAKTPELTLERVAKDGLELAEWLGRRFPASSLFVLGHSWGTAIATRMVLLRPDLFAAYVGTGQIASWAESVNAQFDFLKDKARETSNVTLLAELEAIGRPNPQDAEQYFRFTRTLRQYLDEADSTWLKGIRARLIQAKGYGPKDLEALGQGMDFSGKTLLPVQMQSALSSSSLEFQLPYLVIQGQDDVFTPTSAAAHYFERVKAPVKRLVILQGEGHFALVTDAARFATTLKEALGDLQSSRR